VHDTYPASSSLRVCTLRLPSVVCVIALSSVNVSGSLLAASALTMASRVRSWTSRSSSRGSRAFAAAAVDPLRSSRPVDSTGTRAVPLFALAAMFPRDHESKDDVQDAEPEPEPRAAPRRHGQ